MVMMRCTVLISLMTFASGFIPDGYILQVTHTCGTAVSNSNHSGTNAKITIASDLYVEAKIRCADSLIFNVARIKDGNSLTSARIFYTNETGGTVGTDCFFYHPNDESNLYTVEMDIYWGLTNESLLNDYESYTITCTIDGAATQQLAGKTVDDGILITEDLVGNGGSPYANTATLKLLDVLGREISAPSIRIGKKVFLEMSISGGSDAGLTPYSCYAENSDGSRRYKLLKAGCGDGIIFPKNVGFTTTGTSVKSPFFKIFRVTERLSNSADVRISFSCSFSACAQACDGSSCALRQVKRRSSGKETTVKSTTFVVKQIEDETEKILREFSMERNYKIANVVLIGVGLAYLVTFVLIFYQLCCKQRHEDEEIVPSMKYTS